MPITFAHPAAVVPFTRFGLPLSALVVGSMVPDLPYFLHLSTGADYAHRMPGLVLFCLPAGMGGLWLFHRVLKEPLVHLLPPAHATRVARVVQPFPFLPASRFLVVALSVLLGSVTHVIWDSFTHRTGWTVQHMPLLSTALLSTSYGTLYLFKVLQYLSSLLGTLLLGYAYWQWAKEAREERDFQPLPFREGTRRKIIVLWLLLTSAATLAYSLARNAPLAGIWQVYPLARDGVLAFGVAGFLLLLVYSVLWHVARRDTPVC